MCVSSHTLLRASELVCACGLGLLEPVRITFTLRVCRPASLVGVCRVNNARLASFGLFLVVIVVRTKNASEDIHDVEIRTLNDVT